MRNGFNYVLLVSEMNGLPKANMVGRETVVKIVEDIFRCVHISFSRHPCRCRPPDRLL
jgi:hypothetical protein